MVYLSENGVYSWPPKAGVRVGLVKILFFKFCWGVRIKCSPACGLVDKLWAHSLFIHGKMIPEIIFSLPSSAPVHIWTELHTTAAQGFSIVAHYLLAKSKPCVLAPTQSFYIWVPLTSPRML